MESLQPQVVAYWRVAGVVRGILVGGFIALQGLVFGFASWTVSVIAATIGLSLACVLVGWSLFSSARRFRRFRFGVDERWMRVQDGVLVHREKIVPVARMQHVDVDRGPIERMFGLATIALHTAGGQAATCRIPGLAPERATALREQLLATLEHGRAAPAP